LGEALRAPQIVLQMRNVVQRDERRRASRRHGAYAAAEPLADVLGTRDRLARARQRRGNRGPEAFVQADRDRVERRRERAGRSVERGGGVEDARAVEVQLYAASIAQRGCERAAI